MLSLFDLLTTAWSSKEEGVHKWKEFFIKIMSAGDEDIVDLMPLYIDLYDEDVAEHLPIGVCIDSIKKLIKRFNSFFEIFRYDDEPDADELAETIDAFAKVFMIAQSGHVKEYYFKRLDFMISGGTGVSFDSYIQIQECKEKFDELHKKKCGCSNKNCQILLI
jgi:hypothetical protein